MKRLLFLPLILLLFIQCKKEEVKLGIEIHPLEQTQTITSIDDYVESIEYIIPDAVHYGCKNCITMCSNGDMITFGKSNEIILLNSAGEFKRVIAYNGKGNREFISATSMVLSSGEEYLYVLDDRKIRLFGMEDSTYYSEIELPQNACVDAIAPSEDDHIFLYSAFFGQNPSDNEEQYLVSKIDKTGAVVEKYIKKDDFTFSIFNITQSYGNKYILRPQNADHIFYRFDNTLTPTYRINFGAKNIPHQYCYSQSGSDMETYMTSDYYKMPIYLYETSDVLSFSAAAIGAKQHNFIYLKDKMTGINWFNSFDEPEVPIVSSDENYLYFTFSGINIDSYNQANPQINSPLFRYISNKFLNEWKLTTDDDVIVKIKFYPSLNERENS